MRLAHVSIGGRGATDRFLAAVAGRLEDAGVRLAGTVQTNLSRADRSRCDMDLRVLPDGPVVRISEDRGAAARGCMLDHGALEQTVAEVTRRLEGAGVLIVNKFGRAESEGRGLVPVISEALARGMTVLVGVNALNLPLYLDFAGGLSESLPEDETAATGWCLAGASDHVL